MRKQLIIKHGKCCIDIISYDNNKTCGNDIVETWQKKQTEYLLRGELRPCIWTVSTKQDFIGAMIDSARL